MLGMPINIPYMEPGQAPVHRFLFVLAVLFLPTFDTLRIIIVRLWNGCNPFEADCNHSHHLLLKLGLNHQRASLVLGGVNLLIISVFALLSAHLSTLWLTLALLGIYILVFLVFELVIKGYIAKKVAPDQLNPETQIE